MFVSNFNHFLDADGNIPQSDNKTWKQFAHFNVMIVDVVTQNNFNGLLPTYLTCYKKRCKGKIHAGISDEDNSIVWACTGCRNSGIITEWQGSRWDNSNSGSKNLLNNEL